MVSLSIFTGTLRTLVTISGQRFRPILAGDIITFQTRLNLTFFAEYFQSYNHRGLLNLPLAGALGLYL